MTVRQAARTLASLLPCWLTLLSASTASGQGGPLLVAPNEAPQYRLTNLRVEDDQFGRTVMVFDYTRIREGKGQVRVAGRSAAGPLRITFLPPINQDSGQVRLGKMPGGGAGGYDFEFYFVSPAYWAGTRYGDCLVSNSVRIGNPGRVVSARAWNSEEQAAYQRHLRSSDTPATPPPGYEPVTSATELLPGMPIKASCYGEWADAEVLALLEDGGVTVRYAGENTADTIQRDGWIAIEPRTLVGPTDRFTPSMHVLPGGKNALPRDAGPAPDSVTLVRGTPVLLYRGNDWDEVFVSEDRGPEVEVRYPNHPGRVDWKHDRAEIAVRDATLAQLRAPGAEQRFAKNVIDDSLYEEDEIPMDPDAVDQEEGFGGQRRGGRDNYKVFDRNYPVDVAIPRTAESLPDDIELPRGTPVGYCWGRRWEGATVIADRGPVVIIQEDDSITSIVYRVKRDQLIIRTRKLRELQPAKATTLVDLRERTRTWTDSTGRHKVDARLVLVSDRGVTLRKSSGKEVTLPLERLSEADRALLEVAESASDNPFD